MRKLRTWLNDFTLPTDIIQRQQAPMLQTIILVLMFISIASVSVNLAYRGFTSNIFVIFFVTVLYSVSLIILRRGHFLAALYIVSLSLSLGLFVLFIPRGVRTSGINYILVFLPVLIAGLLGTRRMLWVVVACTCLLFIGIGILENTMPQIVGYDPGMDYFVLGTAIIFVVIIFFPALIIEQFSSTLRRTIVAGAQRESELESIRTQQEAVIAQRTEHLTDALKDVQQREQQLQHTLSDLRSAQEAIREMSVPVLPVLPYVLAIPLIGSIDQQRAETMMRNTLEAVTQERARYVIFDITGVPIVDTHVARVLMRTADAIKLMGANVVLAGVQPDVAQTMVSLGLDMHMFISHPDLRTAIASIQSK